MANVSINSNYVGTAAVPFVAPAILSADTIANGYCSVLENVRYKTNLRKVSGGAITDRSCQWNTSGSLAIADVQLELTQLQVNEQICNEDLRNSWAGEQMRGNFANVPGDYEQFLAQWVASRVAEDVEKNLWQGNFAFDAGTPANDHFNGIMKAYVDGSGTYETLIGGPLTATAPATGTDLSIATQLGVLVSTLPDALVGQETTKIYMSRKSYQLYFQFLASDDNNPVLATQMAKFYLGYEIITPAGFPDDTLVASRKDNMYFGTNVLTDHVEARFIDLRNTTGEDITRILMLFDGGTQIVDEASMACVRRNA